MRNKKKWLTIGGAAGISAVVMVATGFSAMASTSGYDAYKSALKNTKTLKSVSVQAQASLQDNGSVLASADGSVKAELANRKASGKVDVKANGKDQTLNFYRQDNGTVLNASGSDVYYVSQEGNGKWKKHEQDNQAMPQQVETVIDALVGNLKDYVSVDAKTDGTKAISLQLSNAQIPAVVNAIAPIALKNAAEHGDNGKDDQQDGETNDDQNGVQNGAQKDDQNDGETNDDQAAELPFGKDLFKGSVPQLTQDIKIENIALKATINASNYIEHQEADITVSGKDAQGAAHSVTLHVNADLAGFNSTTPDTVDLTGKNVQQVKRGHHGDHQND